MQDLHRVFTRDNYRAWQRAAPRAWNDAFFRTRVPLIIASRYGQDEELTFTSRMADQFEERMRWSDLASVSLAMATDIEYVISSFHFICFLITSLSTGLVKGN